jgi:hypothetical protein
MGYVSIFIGVCLFVCVSTSALAEPRPVSWFRQDFPVPVMHLTGTVTEAAESHARYITDIPGGKDSFLVMANTIESYISPDSSGGIKKIIRGLSMWFYRKAVRDRMVLAIPSEYKAAFKSFAKTMGIPQGQVWDGVVMPDAGLVLISLLKKSGSLPGFKPQLGCTSVIWDQELGVSALHGRNLDYEGVGTWDRQQLIMHIIPKEGLAHVSVAAYGIHAPGITGFNEAGLTLAMHQLSLEDVDARGTPMVIISSEVIRRAHNIDEAIKIIKSFKRAGTWAYVLTHGNEKAVVETSSRDVKVRRGIDPFFFQTNHVMTPSLMKRQSFLGPGDYYDTLERFDKLAKFKGSLNPLATSSPQGVADLISDHARVAGGTIARLDAIQSVIMDAGKKRIWLGVGSDSLAPNEGSFVGYEWSDLRSHAPPALIGSLDSSVRNMNPEVLGLRGMLRKIMTLEDEDPQVSKLLGEYQRSVISMIRGGLPPRGSWAGLYLYVWNRLSYGAEKSAELDLLLKTIDLALLDRDLQAETYWSRFRLSLGYLFRGRILDLLDRRTEAVDQYNMVLDLAFEKPLREAAKKGTKKPYVWEDTGDISISWSDIDLVRY